MSLGGDEVATHGLRQAQHLLHHLVPIPTFRACAGRSTEHAVSDIPSLALVRGAAAGGGAQDLNRAADVARAKLRDALQESGEFQVQCASLCRTCVLHLAAIVHGVRVLLIHDVGQRHAHERVDVVSAIATPKHLQQVLPTSSGMPILDECLAEAEKRPRGQRSLDVGRLVEARSLAKALLFAVAAGQGQQRVGTPGVRLQRFHVPVFRLRRLHPGEVAAHL
mmetsp:Transcript_24762/g.69062  ORF Transcript_24762/g.69062 Transcript_24762/m.69062 type:complete len:222 (+) Transcript_24762:1468-2133(+)